MKTSELKEIIREVLDEGINKRSDGLFDAVWNYIDKNYDNEKLTSYNSQVCNAIVELIDAVDADKLNVGDLFNGLKSIKKKIK